MLEGCLRVVMLRRVFDSEAADSGAELISFLLCMLEPDVPNCVFGAQIPVEVAVTAEDQSALTVCDSIRAAMLLSFRLFFHLRAALHRWTQTSNRSAAA